MIEAAAAAREFARGRTRADLDSDTQFAFALARAVEIFGEAAARLSAERRNAMADVPWRLAIGVRNRIVHADFDLDLDILWTTATEEIQAMVPLLRAALAKDASTD
jgi:uncharacterized protein with HEPN domain